MIGTVCATLVLLLCITGEHIRSYGYHGFLWRDVVFTVYAIGCLGYLVAT